MTTRGGQPTGMSDAVQLRGLLLVASRAELHLEQAPPESDEVLVPSLTVGASDKVDLDSRAYAVSVTFKSTLRRADTDLYTVEATYLLSYELLEALSGEDVERDRQWFATRNAPFNAWPFFREFLHSMATRMGHPGLLLPLFRLPLAPPAASKTE